MSTKWEKLIDEVMSEKIELPETDDDELNQILSDSLDDVGDIDVDGLVDDLDELTDDLPEPEPIDDPDDVPVDDLNDDESD